MNKTYEHSEAFCHMKYRSSDGSITISVWNSRDNYTPFGFTVKGVEFFHVDWNEDRQEPDYKPQPGDLIFVDTTEELIKHYLEEYIDKYWDSNDDGNFEFTLSELFDSKEAAYKNFLKSSLGSPHLLEVE